MTISLPTYESMLTEAIALLAVDVGTVAGPSTGSNILQDVSKSWAPNMHTNRIVKIISGTGKGQQAFIQGNSLNILVIKGAWALGIEAGSKYVIINADYAQILRDVLGGGADISAANPLPVTSEAGIDQGTATGGTNTTLIDVTKGWQVNIWDDAILEVEIGGIQYTREIDSNTATILNFATNPLPAGVVVAAGCVYSIKRLVNPLSPIAKALLHNVVGYVAAADMIIADIAPTNTPCLFRVMGSFTVAGILSVEIINAGNSQVQQFNGGVALNTNSLYAFSHLVHAGDTINYRYSVNTNIMTFRVVEIPSAI